jgi:hypothetical protein
MRRMMTVDLHHRGNRFRIAPNAQPVKCCVKDVPASALVEQCLSLLLNSFQTQPFGAPYSNCSKPAANIIAFQVESVVQIKYDAYVLLIHAKDALLK